METRKLTEQRKRSRSPLTMYVKEKSEIPLVLDSASSKLGEGKDESRSRYSKASTIDGHKW